jgi:DNA-directed RNA polymerase specialized sigma24 family protein
MLLRISAARQRGILLAGHRRFRPPGSSGSRILLADDQALILSGIRSLLEAEDGTEVVALVAHGLSNDEIADAMVLSPATAKTHVSRAMIKLGAPRSRATGCVRLPDRPGHPARRRALSRPLSRTENRASALPGE